MLLQLLQVEIFLQYWEGSKRVEKEKALQITYRSKNKSREYLELSHNQIIKGFDIA